MKIRILVLPFLFCLFCSFLNAQETADFTVKKIGEGVYAAISPDRSKAGSNAGFVVGDDGVLVVDSFISPDAAKELLDEIRKVTDLPIRYVVNTHYHLDHTGGNAVFKQEGATIVAQRNVRDWLHTENMKFFGANPKPEDKARVDALVGPDIVYKKSLNLALGSRRIEVRSLPGHTGGDSVVYIPDTDVVFAGDLVWQHHLPNLIDASTASWIQTLDKLMSEHPKATFVSGHGDIATAADVAAFRDYLNILRIDVAKAQADGKSGQELVDAVTAQLKEKYGQWGFFDHFIGRNIQQTADELAGHKKTPIPVSNKNSAGK
jgi:glyoxylase-like metal-dependent hydrolase (beta-lactamase superfamily II)